MVEADRGMIAAADLDRRRSMHEAVRESNKFWASSFNLENTMADHADAANLDFDEVMAFVEVITLDRDALCALGNHWDAR